MLRLALRGKPYCYYHARLHTFVKRPEPSLMEPIKLPVLEDRAPSSLALPRSSTPSALTASPPRSAGLFLYAIQLASQQVKSSIGTSQVAGPLHGPVSRRRGTRPRSLLMSHYHNCSICDQGEECEEFEPDRRR